MAGRAVAKGHPGLYEVLTWACRRISVLSYLEIGVADGASLLTVMDSAPLVNRLVLCDAWLPNEWHGRTSHAHIEEMLDRLRYGGVRNYLDGSSHEWLKTLQDGPAFDLVLVDGGHHFADAAQDLEEGYGLLRAGGILVFDDEDWPEPHEALAAHWLKHRWKQLHKKHDGINSTVALVKPEEPANGSYSGAAEAVRPVAEEVHTSAIAREPGEEG